MLSKLKAKAPYVLWVLLALSGCGGGGGGSSTDPDAPLTTAQWQQDVDFVATQMETTHPSLFHSITRQEFRTAVDALKADIATLTRNEIFVRLKKLVALPAMEKDGHTLVPMFRATGFRVFPLRLYEFSDGVFVIDANAPYQNAIGQRIVQIGGMDIDQVNLIIDPLITRDNETTVRQKRTLHYVVPELLETLGIIPDAEQGDYLLESATGDFTTLLVTPIDTQTYQGTLEDTVGLPQQSEPLYLSNRGERFWMQLLNESNSLYIRYNLVLADTQSGLTISGFSAQIASIVANNNVQKVIIDVRHNGGGNNATFGPLIDVLSSSAINQPNKLYALIDRVTFSAAGNFVAVLDQRTNAIFVGEPTGGSPNNYGDAVQVNLPNSGFGVVIPTRYLEVAPGDQRTAVSPDIPVSLNAADYFDRRDPVLEAAIAN
ncbi:MAG: hypothetical protein ACR2RB_15020 [Gammaproteobacteria bacterium]